jgi:hypothetical protein
MDEALLPEPAYSAEGNVLESTGLAESSSPPSPPKAVKGTAVTSRATAKSVSITLLIVFAPNVWYFEETQAVIATYASLRTVFFQQR